MNNVVRLELVTLIKTLGFPNPLFEIELVAKETETSYYKLRYQNNTISDNNETPKVRFDDITIEVNALTGKAVKTSFKDATGELITIDGDEHRQNAILLVCAGYMMRRLKPQYRRWGDSKTVIKRLIELYEQYKEIHNEQ